MQGKAQSTWFLISSNFLIHFLGNWRPKGGILWNVYLSESNNTKIMLTSRSCKDPYYTNIQIMLISRWCCIIELTVFNALFGGTFFSVRSWWRWKDSRKWKIIPLRAYFSGFPRQEGKRGHKLKLTANRKGSGQA